MNNINLNPGGVIAAILLMALVIVTVMVTSNPDDAAGIAGGVGVFAVFIGAYGGNILWDRPFPKSD